MWSFRKRKKMVTKKLIDLSPWLETYSNPIAYGVDQEGAIYVAAGQTAEPIAEDQGAGIFPKSRFSQSTSYLVFRWQDGDCRSVVIPNERLVVSYVQPVNNGFLLVGARCYWRPDGAEKNAVQYDWDGNEIRRFTLGDGINDVRTTPNQSVWVSYFDEGVFGNYGWHSPGPECIGSSGCVRFDINGNVSFHFSPDDAGTDIICDAYAMNVVGDNDVWIYFYTEFPIAHITNGQYTVWDFGIGGAAALAVEHDRVLLFGDYNKHNLVRIVQLGTDNKVTILAEMPLVDESGAAITNALPYGVGKYLYLFREKEVLIVDSW